MFAPLMLKQLAILTASLGSHLSDEQIRSLPYPDQLPAEIRGNVIEWPERTLHDFRAMQREWKACTDAMRPKLTAKLKELEALNERVRSLPHPALLSAEIWGNEIEWTEKMLADFRAQRKELEARKDGDWSKSIAGLKEIEANFEKSLEWLKRQR